MRWTWDDRKARANLAKHRVSFELAEIALGDANALTVADDDEDGDRWRTLCSVVTAILFVVHTWPVDTDDGDEEGRIISARKETARERDRYGQLGR